MKMPIILKNDVILVCGATVLSVIGMFGAYRFGRRAEIDELIDIVSDQGCTTFKFSTKNRYDTKILMEIIE